MDIRRQLRRTVAKLEEEALLQDATLRSADLIAARLIRAHLQAGENLERESRRIKELP